MVSKKKRQFFAEIGETRRNFAKNRRNFGEKSPKFGESRHK
jgi:hypothetical protein